MTIEFAKELARKRREGEADDSAALERVARCTDDWVSQWKRRFRPNVPRFNSLQKRGEILASYDKITKRKAASAPALKSKSARILTNEQETEVFDQVMQLHRSGSRLTPTMIKTIAYQVARERLPGEVDDTAALERVRRLSLCQSWVNNWKNRVKHKLPLEARYSRQYLLDRIRRRDAASTSTSSTSSSSSDCFVAIENIGHLVNDYLQSHLDSRLLPADARLPSDSVNLGAEASSDSSNDRNCNNTQLLDDDETDVTEDEYSEEDFDWDSDHYYWSDDE